MFSLFFPLPESRLPSKAPPGLSVPTPRPGEASPGALQRVSGALHVCVLLGARVI